MPKHNTYNCHLYSLHCSDVPKNQTYGSHHQRHLTVHKEDKI